MSNIFVNNESIDVAILLQSIHTDFGLAKIMMLTILIILFTLFIYILLRWKE